MKAYFVIPGDIDQPTGGYGYDRQVLAHAGAVGLDLVHVPVPGGFPFASPQALDETGRIIAGLPGDGVLLIDGLAYGALPAGQIASFAPRRIVELCHHPLALEPGLTAAQEGHLRANERSAMELAAAIIVTGPLTARTVAADFHVAPEKISVALPGTSAAPRAKGSGSPTPHLLAIGSIIPRKGHDILVEAMARNADLDWHLDIFGSTTHSPATVNAVQALIEAHGLSRRIVLHGGQPASVIAQAYDKADVFVLASHYEGYGMVIAEAMAHGLPIISSEAGAVADTLDPHAGILVPVKDVELFARAVRIMLTSPGKRSQFSQGSWNAGQKLPGWDQTVRTIRRVLEGALP